MAKWIYNVLFPAVLFNPATNQWCVCLFCIRAWFISVFFVENFSDYLKVFSLEESFDRNCSIVLEVGFIVLGSWLYWNEYIGCSRLFYGKGSFVHRLDLKWPLNSLPFLNCVR